MKTPMTLFLSILNQKRGDLEHHRKGRGETRLTHAFGHIGEFSMATGKYKLLTQSYDLDEVGTVVWE